jgi:predicted amidophosphoribosyltransferase
MQAFLKSIWKEFMLLVFPINCAGCSKWDLSVCPSCMRAINKSPFLSDRFPIWVANIYALPIRSIILQWKDHGRSDLDFIMKNRIIHSFDAGFGKKNRTLTLVPIPSSKKMSKNRGFSQTLLLAKTLENRFPEVKVCELLFKKGSAAAHKTNKKLSRNAEFIFNEKAKCSRDYPVVLIDDVLTTGGTYEKCKSRLEEKGFQVLGAAVIAEAG